MLHVESATLDEAFAQFDDRRENLIPILQEVQATYSYLPEDILRHVSRKLRVPLPQVYQVATFYRCFSLKPRGKHVVQVCLGTACHVRGAARVLDAFSRELGVAPGGTTKDLKFSLSGVRCLGCCGLAPVMRVDRDVYATLEQSKVKRVLDRYRAGSRRAARKGASHD